MTKLALIAFSVGVGVGLLGGWIIGFGETEFEKEVVSVVYDTLLVEVTDTLTYHDTTHQKPEIKYVSRRVHDTIFVAEKIREYHSDKTFEDSAWVDHRFGIRDIDNILTYNDWNYKPAPVREVYKTKVVEVSPSTTKKVFKAVGWVALGGGAAAIINNNK